MCKQIWNVDCGVWLIYCEQTQVQFWYNRFKEDREDVNDDARPGRPSTSTALLIMLAYCSAHAKQFFEYRRITIREVVGDIGILFGSCQAIFTDVLCIKRAAGMIVSKLLDVDDG